MKRFIIVLLVVGALFGAAYGAAAALNVTGGPTQAGSLTGLVCDADGVHVDGYGVELDDLSGHFLAVSGIDANCAGLTLGAQIKVQGGPNFNISGTIPAGGGAMNIPFPSPVPLEKIIGVNLVIG